MGEFGLVEDIYIDCVATWWCRLETCNEINTNDFKGSELDGERGNEILPQGMVRLNALAAIT